VSLDISHIPTGNIKVSTCERCDERNKRSVRRQYRHLWHEFVLVTWVRHAPARICMYVCARLRVWTAVTFFSKADFLSHSQWILVLTITQRLKFTTYLFQKTSSCSFLQFLSSLTNRNQFIFAGCKHMYLFWDSHPQASFAVILNFNFLHWQKSKCNISSKDVTTQYSWLVVQTHFTATKNFLFISHFRQPPVEQLSLLTNYFIYMITYFHHSLYNF
jgi:hypothetical protein